MHKTKANKILFINYYFPPTGTIASLRNYNVAMECSKYFKDTHLITLKKKLFQMDEEFNLDFLKTHEIKSVDYRSISGFFTRENSLNETINASSKSKRRVWIRKVLDTYPLNLFWGEGGFIYIKNALKETKKLIKNEKITHIYSSFRPFTDHYIAWKLKMEFPQLIWIADFRDLPVDENRKNTFFPGFQHRKMTSILSKANILLTVSIGLKKVLNRYNDRVLVIRSGLRRHFLPASPKENNKFQIAYTGSLYPGFQDVSPLFASLKEILNKGQIEKKDIELHYAGKDARIWNKYVEEYALESISSNHGKLTLTKAIELQHGSRINLLLSWNGPHSGGVLTGKLSDYLAAGKTILCLMNGAKEEEMERLLKELNAGVACYPDDRTKLKDFILKEYEQWKAEKPGNYPFDKEKLFKYQWDETIRPLIDYLFSSSITPE